MNVGFFGKIPSHGDFVERKMSAPFKDVWDDWLQHGIASSKALIGEAWLQTYLTSPVWRFALASGICGEQGWVGVMVPSVDKVGRYFPLTIAAPVDSGSIPLQALVAAADWHDAAQALALAALAEEIPDADQLEQALGTRCGQVFSQPPITCEAPLSDPRESLHGHALCLPFAYGSTPGHGLLAFSHRLLEALYGVRHTVWWTHGSELVHPGMFACAGLPSPDAFAGMLGDAYAASGWVRMAGYAVSGSESDVAAEQPTEPAADMAASRGAAGERLEVADSQAPVDDSPTTQFDDLIVDAQLPDTTEAPTETVDRATLEEDAESPISSAVGPESTPEAEGIDPVPVSADEILAGFGESDDEDITQRKANTEDEAAGEKG